MRFPGLYGEVTAILSLNINSNSYLQFYFYISAVFLIPYAIIMVFIGGPMLYMELAVGQFTGRGPIGALGHLCPLFKGNNALYKTTQLIFI